MSKLKRGKLIKQQGKGPEKNSKGNKSKTIEKRRQEFLHVCLFVW